MAGQVAITVKAQKSEGFDKSKLTNGVPEPLREADLIQKTSHPKPLVLLAAARMLTRNSCFTIQ
jgi:hypothetical protein